MTPSRRAASSRCTSSTEHAAAIFFASSSCCATLNFARLEADVAPLLLAVASFATAARLRFFTGGALPNFAVAAARSACRTRLKLSNRSCGNRWMSASRASDSCMTGLFCTLNRVKRGSVRKGSSASSDARSLSLSTKDSKLGNWSAKLSAMLEILLRDASTVVSRSNSGKLSNAFNSFSDKSIVSNPSYANEYVNDVEKPNMGDYSGPMQSCACVAQVKPSKRPWIRLKKQWMMKIRWIMIRNLFWWISRMSQRINAQTKFKRSASKNFWRKHWCAHEDEWKQLNIPL